MAGREDPDPSRPPWRLLRRSAKPLLIQGVGPAAAAALFGALVYQAVIWPDAARLAQANPKTTAFIERYTERHSNSGQTAELRWLWVPYDNISPHLKRAVLVAEDINFFSHSGFEFGEIKLAVREALSGERGLRGASTVEFGPGVYGAEAAARYYFGKPASELDEQEAAQLAAALPRPSRWNPRSDSESYRSYAARIVERMDRAQFLWRRI